MRKRVPSPKYEKAKALLRKFGIKSYKDDRHEGKSIKPLWGVGAVKEEVGRELNLLADPLSSSMGHRYFFYMPLVCKECYHD
jgi:hypothetical protein